uniref:Uncharacterized protein n=1 Tax=Rhizophagus irregularis (strain DAOM 181602 / DAOM 197198 / MUCL 43194) TaxID=747089 RepID=U9SKS0_RHIID
MLSKIRRIWEFLPTMLTGSQPARYCHCVPSISNDLSLPFRSFSCQEFWLIQLHH